jgi:rubrerythrin
LISYADVTGVQVCEFDRDQTSTIIKGTTSRRHQPMPELKGSQTHDNLKEAFAGESQANRRYLYFAQKADVEGYPDVAGLFRSVAEGETGHAFGHFDFLAEVGDPVTDVPVGPTEANLKSAIEGETYEYTEMYPGFSTRARVVGFLYIPAWLATRAGADQPPAARFAPALDNLLSERGGGGSPHPPPPPLPFPWHERSTSPTSPTCAPTSASATSSGPRSSP